LLTQEVTEIFLGPAGVGKTETARAALGILLSSWQE
jgi:ATP-dependent Clp protease ATP-binding subunit ClpA